MARRRQRDQVRLADIRVWLLGIPNDHLDLEEEVIPIGNRPADPGRMRKRLAEFKSEVERIFDS